MGIYPCRGCGALFISVNMTQEPHAPGCPLIQPCARCGHSNEKPEWRHDVGRRPRRVECVCAPRSETNVRDGRHVRTIIHSLLCPVTQEQGTIFEDKGDGPVGDSG